eukprot:7632425-Pyramimonas_sp.AAC.1
MGQPSPAAVVESDEDEGFRSDDGKLMKVVEQSGREAEEQKARKEESQWKEEEDTRKAIENSKRQTKGRPGSPGHPEAAASTDPL